MHALKADRQLGADGAKGPQRKGGGVMVLQQWCYQAPQLLPGLLLSDHPLLLQPVSRDADSGRPDTSKPPCQIPISLI